MVELKSDEREQAAVLCLLTHCIHSSPQLAAQFEGFRGSSLVFRILRSPFSCPGVQVMKVSRRTKGRKVSSKYIKGNGCKSWK